jgi:hypothetical protein
LEISGGIFIAPVLLYLSHFNHSAKKVHERIYKERTEPKTINLFNAEQGFKHKNERTTSEREKKEAQSRSAIIFLACYLQKALHLFSFILDNTFS